MANRVYIIAKRNDLDGMNVQITDLRPNTSQKNGIYDGEGQTHYVAACLDTAGTTKTIGNAYVSGSRSTALSVNPVIGDTTGGGDDNYAPVAATFGLAAYLRERIAKDSGGANTFLTFANANTIAAAIRARVEAGSSLAASDINTLLTATGGGVTTLTAGGSFGTVEDILRILSGEVYRSPKYTIITDAAPNFISLADRQVLVAAQLPATTGKTFVAQGGFLTSMESGYVGRPMLTRTGSFNSSLGAGQIKAFKSAKVIKNSAFAYGSTGSAFHVDGTTHIGTSGSAAVLSVYDKDGNAL